MLLIDKMKKYSSIPAIYDKLKYYFYDIFNKWLYRYSFLQLSDLKIYDINSTIDLLINSHKSLSRFGDGEFRWLLDDCHNSFQRSSKLLSKRLKEVITSQYNDLMIGLPNSFRTFDNLTVNDKKFWRIFIAEYGKKILPYLNYNKQYYNTSISRVYINYVNKSRAGYYFNKLKMIWDNKNILLIEGDDSRLGVNDGLFDNVKSIDRIECPSVNAFESYEKIISSAKSFLSRHKHFLTLLSLGPTATVMSYDLFKCGYRVIDVGNIDIEYNWYLMGATKKVNIPSRYTIEALGGTHVTNVHNKKYNNEIIKVIR